ncbi:uncharacterized protein LOC134786875 [Penaeus indicus]|uniref:uncharacterized protein LOC134786875 n=1 Tax=Penaeus indicus TaxID=29960 RepID=UPI00300C6F11
MSEVVVVVVEVVAVVMEEMVAGRAVLASRGATLSLWLHCASFTRVRPAPSAADLAVTQSPPPRPARQLRDLIRNSLLPHSRDQNKCQQVSAASVPVLREARALCPVHTFSLKCQCSAFSTRAFLACAAASPTRPTGALSVKIPPALSALRGACPRRLQVYRCLVLCATLRVRRRGRRGSEGAMEDHGRMCTCWFCRNKSLSINTNTSSSSNRQ